VAVARVNLLSTVDAVARWDRRYMNPAVYSIRTDFGRLAERYEAVRGRKLEELKRKYPLAGRDEEEMRIRGKRGVKAFEGGGVRHQWRREMREC
jgi:hypothetical protein